MAKMKNPTPSPSPAGPRPVAAAFYKADGYLPDDTVGYLMRRVWTAVASEIERELESSDLTSAQWLPLLKRFMGQAFTVAELARGCHLDASAMTRLLDRLEAKGLCRRLRSVAVRRVVNVELTDNGRAAAEGIPAVLSRVQNAHLAGFSVEEFETLKGFLRRMLATMPAKVHASNLPILGYLHEA